MQGATVARLSATQLGSLRSITSPLGRQDRAEFLAGGTAFIGSNTRKEKKICIAETRRDVVSTSGECQQAKPSTEHLGFVPGGCSRRHLAALVASGLCLPWLGGGASTADVLPQDEKKQYTDMPALRGKDYGKTRMTYPDYVETDTGLQYKDLREGSGPPAKRGDLVVIDWDGFTIGYYGRIFEARNKAKGGSFEGNEKDFYRFRLGVDKVIPAFEEAIQGMQVGGVRRIIVPPELGYPDNDYRKAGPAPITFSGQRALSFVLENQGLIDKTLLFDIELLRVTPME